MGGPEMAPQTPQTFGAPRRSRAAPLSPTALGAARRSRATTRQPLAAPPEPAQRREVAQIGGRLRLLGRLQDFGHARETSIVEQQAEWAQAEPAAPDVLVTVEARAEGRA